MANQSAAGAPPADLDQVARQILLNRLSDRPRSRAELATSLASKHVPDDVAMRVLDRFEEVGLVDDAAFASAWVTSRHRGRGLGRRALAHELRRKGIDEELARTALADVDDADERTTAAALIQRRVTAMRRLDRVSAQRRLLGMLARKGYGPAVAVPVVQAAMTGWGEGAVGDGGEAP